MSTTIPKSAFDFLSKLEKNNNREWFTEHKPEFKEEEQKIKEFYQSLFELMSEHDLIESHKLMRIYRDVRFSKDKTPYSPRFAGSFTRATAARRGGYYLHLAPGASMIGGGFWQPSKEDLYRIRKEFEMDDSAIRKIIASRDFQKHFGLYGIHGEELKTAPRDFDKEHPAIDLIRKKGFIVRKDFSDKDVHSKNFMTKVNDTFKAMRPFFDYMSEVLTTDLNGRSII